MKRSLSVLLLTGGLLLSACSGSQSGDSNGESPSDEAPGAPDKTVATAPPQ